MKFTPHEYQRFAIEKILELPSCGLFLDMGLGKTVITLSAVYSLIFERFEVHRVLVIAPKTVAETTWTNEVAKWDHLHGLTVIPVLGTARQRKAALSAPAFVYVINRENVVWLEKEMGAHWDFDMVVIDESSSFKNSSSQRFRALRRVRPKIKRLVELTGTPAPNGMQDLWAQLWLMDGGKRLGRTLTSFRDGYCKQDYAYPGQAYRTYSLLPGADKRILEKLSDICISMKSEDYLTLPEYIEVEVPVMLTDSARESYDEFEQKAVLEICDTEITAQSAAVLSAKLLQLCSGMIYDEEGVAVPVHDCKTAAFLDLLESLNGEHALVFYWFQHERDRLEQLLAGTQLRFAIYQGPKQEADWNAGKLDILLANPASCGYGLNLQAGGHHAVWFGLPNWNLEIYQQANKRLHRQGQEYPVICHRLVVDGGMDQDVIKALESKGAMQESLMQALKARIKKRGGPM